MCKIQLTVQRIPGENINYNEEYLRELNKFSVEFDEDFTANEFNLVCRRIASALGYAETSIDESFAPISESRYENVGADSHDINQLFTEDDMNKSCKCKCGCDFDFDDMEQNDDEHKILREIPEDLFQKIVTVLRYKNENASDNTISDLLKDIKNTYKVD